MAVMTSSFTGFKPEAVDFLVELSQHNDRAWFQPRKADYERLLKRPLEDLCVALDEAFRARRVPLMADPAKSPFRIYRDVRFSKDKSPNHDKVLRPASRSKTNPAAPIRNPTGTGMAHREASSGSVKGPMRYSVPTQVKVRP